MKAPLAAPNPPTAPSRQAAGVFAASPALRRGDTPHPPAPSTHSHPGFTPRRVAAQGKPTPAWDLSVEVQETRQQHQPGRSRQPGGGYLSSITPLPPPRDHPAGPPAPHRPSNGSESPGRSQSCSATRSSPPPPPPAHH